MNLKIIDAVLKEAGIKTGKLDGEKYASRRNALLSKNEKEDVKAFLDQQIGKQFDINSKIYLIKDDDGEYNVHKDGKNPFYSKNFDKVWEWLITSNYVEII